MTAAERDPHPDWPIGEVRTVAFHPHNRPLPHGARHVEGATVTDHHRHYGSFIEIVDDGFALGREG